MTRIGAARSDSTRTTASSTQPGRRGRFQSPGSLVDQGVVERLPAGNAQLYSLNRDHLLAGAVEQMANAHAELTRRLRVTIGSWETPAVHASLFGSAARGDGDTHSDIDLLIVRPANLDAESRPWRAQVDALAEEVRRWTGEYRRVAKLIAEIEYPRHLLTVGATACSSSQRRGHMDQARTTRS